MSEEFAGLVIVAIAGNAVENIVGVQAAAANKTDLATSLILNSSLQVAIALTPAIRMRVHCDLSNQPLASIGCSSPS